MHPFSLSAGFTFVYLGLAYSLLVAYISKASEVVGYFAHGTLPPAAGAVGFVAALATLLFAGGTKGADKLNQVRSVPAARAGRRVIWMQWVGLQQSSQISSPWFSLQCCETCGPATAAAAAAATLCPLGGCP